MHPYFEDYSQHPGQSVNDTSAFGDSLREFGPNFPPAGHPSTQHGSLPVWSSRSTPQYTLPAPPTQQECMDSLPPLFSPSQGHMVQTSTPPAQMHPQPLLRSPLRPVNHCQPGYPVRQQGPMSLSEMCSGPPTSQEPSSQVSRPQVPSGPFTFHAPTPLSAYPTITNPHADNWRDCVPNQPRQPIRKAPSSSRRGTLKEVRQGLLTEIRQREMQLGRQKAREQNEEFMTRLVQAKRKLDEEAKEISAEFNKKEAVVYDTLHQASSLKSKRKVSLYDAKLHHASSTMTSEDWLPLFESNEFVQFRDQHIASRSRMNVEAAFKGHVLRRMISSQPQYTDPSSEFQKQILADLQAYRDMKSVGVRASDRSASQDVAKLWGRLNTELTNVYARTGSITLAFTSRSHLGDSTVPTWICTGNAADFIRDVFHLEPWQFMTKFESWSAAHNHAISSNIIPELQQIVSSGLRSCLEFCTNGKTSYMQYKNFDKDIKSKYNLKLVGWPEDLVQFQAPSDIKKLETLQKLRDLLDQGALYLAPMNAIEIAEHKAKMAQKEAMKAAEDSANPPPPRRPRPDKGGTHKKAKKASTTTQAKTNRQPRRGRQTGLSRIASVSAQVPPTYKSAEYILDSDNEGAH